MLVSNEPDKLVILDGAAKGAVSFNLQDDGSIKIITSGNPIITPGEAFVALQWFSDVLAIR